MINQVDIQSIKLGEAKEKKYLKSSHIHDTSQVIYEVWCERENIPFINVHEHKKGYVTLKVTLPHNKELNHQTREDIANIAEKFDIFADTHDFEHWMQVRVRPKEIRSLQSIPIDKAIPYVEKIVEILSQKGMFDVK